MRTLAVRRRALSISVAAALLAGCGGSQGAVSPPVGPQSGGAGSAHELWAPALHGPRSASEVQWVSSGFYSSGDLIEFDYPKSESPIGQITLATAGGECTKGRRTFWVSTSASSQSAIEEFTASGRGPIKTLKPGGSSCAVDPATGDVAVLSSSGVVIFKGGN